MERISHCTDARARPIVPMLTVSDYDSLAHNFPSPNQVRNARNKPRNTLVYNGGNRPLKLRPCVTKLNFPGIGKFGQFRVQTQYLFPGAISRNVYKSKNVA